MVKWLHCLMVKWLDGKIAKWLNGWMVGKYFKVEGFKMKASPY
jgi:hypothetical protein